MAPPSKILLVSDFEYQARGRVYYEEDLFLSARLREVFSVAVVNPRNAVSFMEHFKGVVLFRNTGPVSLFANAYSDFRRVALDEKILVYNELTGKADMQGKQYLLDLFCQGFPVVPSIASLDDLSLLPSSGQYLTKPLDGADSLGVKYYAFEQLARASLDGQLLQPLLEIEYEVSFYFLDNEFHYALYAPDRERRWELKPYKATEHDLAFARRFIEWNALRHGIQRVDAARTVDGQLLLMELEDINPYLSLSLLEHSVRERFVESLIAALQRRGLS